MPTRDTDTPGYTSYRGNIGYWPDENYPLFNGLFYRNSKLDDRDITDGLSQTILFGETQLGSFWSDAFLVARVRNDQPDPIFDKYLLIDLDYFPTYYDINGRLLPTASKANLMYSYGSHHGDVLNISYAEASVRTISKNADGNVFRALCTRNGHEPIEDPL